MTKIVHIIRNIITDSLKMFYFELRTLIRTITLNLNTALHRLNSEIRTLCRTHNFKLWRSSHFAKIKNKTNELSYSANIANIKIQ